MKSQSVYPLLSRPHRSQTGSSWEADGKDPQEQRSLLKNSLFCEHEAELASHQGVFVGLIKTEIKKKAFVLMHARVAPLFWERVGGCHPRGKQRLGEEALGAPMVFWVPQPSVLLGKGSRRAAWGHFTKRHSETLFCQHAGVQSCYQPQKMGEPRTRGTDLGMAQVEPINLM